MLSDTPDHWSKGLLELPVNTIVEHVEQHDSLVSDANIAVSLKLNEQFLDPIEPILVISDLGHKEGSLDLLKILHLL
jgi:hypothetical protein